MIGKHIILSKSNAALMKSGRPSEIEAADRILKSHPFIFEDIAEGLMMPARDYALQLGKFGLLRLPYPCVTFQIGPIEPEEGDTEHTPRFFIICAWENGDCIAGRLFTARTSGISMSPYVFQLNLPFKSEDYSFALGSMSEQQDWDYDHTEQSGYSASEDDLKQMERTLFLGQLLICLGILSSKGIKQTEVKAPKALNAARQRKGKPPIFGYRWVSVDFGEVKLPGLANGENHAPPRLHWRRGHIRRLPNGKITAVKPCLVGDISRGEITKGYRANLSGAQSILSVSNRMFSA